MLLLGLCNFFAAPPIVNCRPFGEFKPSANWSVVAADTNVKILWQLSRNLPPAQYFIDLPNSGIVASGNQVVVREEEWRENGCDAEEGIVALNLYTGTEEWRLPSPPPETLYSSYIENFHDLKTTSDGYILVTNDNAVLKVDYTGKILWVNRELPSRQLRTVYVYADKDLILRTRWGAYVLSAETGKYLSTSSIPNIVAHYGNFYLVGDAKRQEISTFINSFPDTPLFTIKVPDADLIPGVQSSASSFTDFTQNSLFVYNSTWKPDEVTVYDASIGEKLWQLKKRFQTFPVLLYRHIVAYTADGLKIYNYSTGELEHTIQLKRNPDPRAKADEPNSVWVAVSNNIVVLNFRATSDVIALQINALNDN
jgi:outer membrane protein assembly factor BamB